MIPELSVVIINYNTKDYTLNCLSSIYEFEKKGNFEIILVDNGSSECDPDIFKERFPELILIKNPENAGFSRGNNLGIRAARGEFILLLNSDTMLLNDAFSKALERIRKDDKIAVLSSMLKNENGTLQHPASRFPSLKMELAELFRLTKNYQADKRSAYYLGEAFDHITESTCDWVWGTFFLIRKSVLALFPDKELPAEFFMYGEDLHWCWSVHELGYKVLYFPEAILLHFGGASMNLMNEKKKYYAHKFPNTYKVVALHKGYCYAWLLYFVKALHYLTLRKKDDLTRAGSLMKFLFGRKSYSLNKL